MTIGDRAVHDLMEQNLDGQPVGQSSARDYLAPGRSCHCGRGLAVSTGARRGVALIVRAISHVPTLISWSEGLTIADGTCSASRPAL